MAGQDNQTSEVQGNQGEIRTETHVWRSRKSSRGYTYCVWERIMPRRVPEELLGSVIYLYPSEESAFRGDKAGGSGFLVCVRSQMHPELVYPYAVTNSHVIDEGRSPVIRINTRSGSTDVIGLSGTDWKHHPDGDDVAVAVIAMADEHKVRCISSEDFLTRDVMAREEISPGDEVCMMGRFANHEGTQQNYPAVRFGSVAVLPHEPIANEMRKRKQESFLVEMHSIPGYSGSPVLVIPALIRQSGIQQLDRTRLLGIDWCHLKDRGKVYREPSGGGGEEVPFFVEYNTGMAGVIPAWKLQELLDVPDFMAQRQQRDEAVRQWKARNDPSALDTA